MHFDNVFQKKKPILYFVTYNIIEIEENFDYFDKTIFINKHTFPFLWLLDKFVTITLSVCAAMRI